MPPLPSRFGAVSLFVSSVAASKAFYQRLFETEPVFEDATSVVFAFGDTVLNLVNAGEAPELIEPAAVAAPASGSRFMLTIWVPDADAACEAVREREIRLLNGPIDRPWGVRTAAFADPDGHVWEIAQQRS